MSRRSVTLLIAGIGALAALIVAVALPVPYVALTPGPTLNTLGSASGQQLIQIKGHRTYPATGHLNLVTIRLLGGPGTHFDVFAALGSWLTPQDAVVPETEVFTPGQTARQNQQQDIEEMASSQQAATAAALCQLNISFTTVDTVQEALPGMPARGVLRSGDVIRAVNGIPVNCRHDAPSLIRAVRAGSPVELTIARGGRTRQVRLRTADVRGQAEVGVDVAESFVFPFTVKIDVSNIGGPSAGLMFALGIIDKLTPANLTGGRFVAGTGEIEADGTVDPIGGIQQKMVGARAAGATVFLTPTANCPDTSGAIPAGLRLIKVSSLAGAISDLHAIARGQPVPSC